MFFSRRGRGGTGGGGGEAVATRNILNGVLNCAWDKTSATPKLLEIYDTSKVKLNIDADNPLTLAFANGWDDLDRPAQVVKRLAVAPSNVDLSAKANCHVQIVAKVINDELVITTHDIYDPGIVRTSVVTPTFNAGYVDEAPFNTTNQYKSTKGGWSVYASGAVRDSNSYPRRAIDGNPAKSSEWSSTAMYNSWYLTSPFPFYVAAWDIRHGTGACDNSGYAYNPLTETWDRLIQPESYGTETFRQHVINSVVPYSAFRIYCAYGNGFLASVDIYEQPTAKFFRSLNKVKDRSDVEQLWINLGYATVDANGAITALNHYTDLRNNYPGGMRVEA